MHSMTQTRTIPTQRQVTRASEAVIDDSLCEDDFTTGLESMNIGASGFPAVVLVNEGDRLRFHVAAEMSTDELRRLVSQAANALNGAV